MPLVCEFDTLAVRAETDAKPQAKTHNLMACFPRTLVARPRLAHGFRALDIDRSANTRVKSTIPHFTDSWADWHIETWNDSTLYRGVDQAFILAPRDIDFLTGEHMRRSNNSPSTRISFERPFVTPPHVVVFFNYIDLEKNRNWRLHASASAVDTKGFTLSIDTWGDTVLHAAQACWIAYPEDREHILSASIHTMDPKCTTQPRVLQWQKDVTFGAGPFWDKPSVFVALNFIDADCKANLRINAYVDGVSKTGLVCHIDSWDDTVLYAAGVSIIAFN